MPVEVPLYYCDHQHSVDGDLYEGVAGSKEVEVGLLRFTGGLWNIFRVHFKKIPNNVEIEAYCQNLGTTEDYQLSFSIIDLTDSGYYWYLSPVAASNSIERKDAGVFTKLISGSPQETREWLRFKVLRRDGYLALYKNNSPILEVTDTTYVKPFDYLEVISRGQAEWDWIKVRGVS